MSRSFLLSTCLLSTLALVASGCDHELESDASSYRSGGRSMDLPGDPEGGVWINNGLDDPDVSGIDPAFALSSSQGLAEDHGLLLDPERWDTVQYLVECALPQGRELTKQVGDDVLKFQGGIGLAPEWEHGTCNEDCQEWVSACLLARTNVTGEEVSIWMRADHPAIGEGMSLQYPIYEASFFGNLFVDPESQHLCQGTVVGPLLAQLEGRTCSNLLGEPCDFTTYTLCELQERCWFQGLNLLGAAGSTTAVGCIAGTLDDGPSLHTISTYVSVL